MGKYILNLLTILNMLILLNATTAKLKSANIKQSSSFSQQDDNQLLNAVKLNDKDKVCLLIKDKNIDINSQDIQGNTSLHIAIKKGFNLMALFLLKNEANPNVQDRNGNTPLHNIIFKNGLIKKNNESIFGISSNNSKRENIFNPLLKDQPIEERINIYHLNIMTIKNNIKMINVLLKYNANPNIQNNDKDTALHIATILDQERVVQLLLNFEAECNITDNALDTPLNIAVRKNHLNIIKMLILSGANLNTVDNLGDTPLHTAVIYNNDNDANNILNILLSFNNLKVNSKNKLKLTPLRIAMLNRLGMSSKSLIEYIYKNP